MIYGRAPLGSGAYGESVAASIGVTVTPGVGAVTFTGSAPTVTAGASVAPGAGTETYTGLAPTVSTGDVVTETGGYAAWWQEQVNRRAAEIHQSRYSERVGDGFAEIWPPDAYAQGTHLAPARGGRASISVPVASAAGSHGLAGQASSGLEINAAAQGIRGTTAKAHAETSIVGRGTGGSVVVASAFGQMPFFDGSARGRHIIGGRGQGGVGIQSSASGAHAVAGAVALSFSPVAVASGVHVISGGAVIQFPQAQVTGAAFHDPDDTETLSLILLAA